MEMMKQFVWLHKPERRRRLVMTHGGGKFKPMPHRQNQKVGIMVAWSELGRTYVGFSQVNLKAGDLFNEQTGIDMAKQLARLTFNHVNISVSGKVARDLHGFIDRANRYFKNSTLPKWASLLLKN